MAAPTPIPAFAPVDKPLLLEPPDESPFGLPLAEDCGVEAGHNTRAPESCWLIELQFTEPDESIEMVPLTLALFFGLITTLYFCQSGRMHLAEWYPKT